jgi:AraC-like DNA-binding protein
MTNKIGRPEKELDWKVLDAILQYGAKLIDCAEILGLSDDTVQRKIKAEYGCTFSEYRDSKMSRTRVKLMQKQIEVALSGNVPMLIWTGKQYLGQTDKAESSMSIESTQPIVLAYKLDE